MFDAIKRWINNRKNPLSKLRKAFKAEQKKDYRGAVYYYLAAIDQSDSNSDPNGIAHTIIGGYYYSGGPIVRQDKKRGEELIKLAIIKYNNPFALILAYYWKLSDYDTDNDRSIGSLLLKQLFDDLQSNPSHPLSPLYYHILNMWGIYLFEGYGIPSNRQKGLSLLRLSADKGNIHAMCNLGIEYTRLLNVAKNNDEGEGVNTITTTPSNNNNNNNHNNTDNNSNNDNNSALSLIKEFDITKEKVLFYYSRSINNGINYPQPLYELGYLRLLDNDQKGAINYFQKAASLDHIDSHIQLANLYRSTISNKNNNNNNSNNNNNNNNKIHKKIYYHCKFAADHDNAEGMAGLSICYSEGIGIDPDESLALHWAKLSANHQQPSIWLQYRLSIDYEKGDKEKHIEKNLYASAYWTKKSAEGDNAESQFKIGIKYLTGHGVGKDEGEGIYWLQLAANNGMKEAENYLNQIQKYTTNETLFD